MVGQLDSPYVADVNVHPVLGRPLVIGIRGNGRPRRRGGRDRLCRIPARHPDGDDRRERGHQRTPVLAPQRQIDGGRVPGVDGPVRECRVIPDVRAREHPPRRQFRVLLAFAAVCRRLRPRIAIQCPAIKCRARLPQDRGPDPYGNGYRYEGYDPAQDLLHAIGLLVGC